MKILDLMQRFFRKKKVLPKESDLPKVSPPVALKKKIYKTNRRREVQIKKRKAKAVLFKLHNKGRA